jgi:competence protein ComEA
MRWRSVLAHAIAIACFSAATAAQTAGPQSTATPPAKTTGKAETTAATPVNLNTAKVADLEKLPGVGPAMAARIVEYREKNGGFKKVEELMNVKGIGEKAFLKLKALVLVAPPKTIER